GRLPDYVSPLATLVVNVTPARSKMFLPPMLAHPTPDGPSVAVPMPRAAARRGTPLEVAMEARVAPALEDRDLRTRPITIPEGAILQLAMGVEESAWLLQTGPLRFRVTAEEDDRKTVLSETRVDPAGWALHRRWLENRIDLAPVVGRTVRLRL